MECTLWRDMASDYIEGTLPPAMTEAMRSHTAGCADCRRDAEALGAIWRELNVLPTVDPPLFFRENVIAAIERQSAGRPVGPWWKTILPNLGRVALGTALTGGVVAAVAWTLLLPTTGVSHQSQANVVTAPEPLSVLLPGTNSVANSATSVSEPPALRIARVTSMVPGTDGPSYDFSFWLENAQKGTARWHFIGDNTAYRFMLSSAAAQTVRIPYSAAQGRDSLALAIYWTANGASHTRYLLLPVPKNADKAPDERQAFGLPTESVVDAARQVAERFGTPITLDDVSADLHVSVSARDESAVDALTRSLSGAGLKVTDSRAGILIQSMDAPVSAQLPVDDPTVAGSGSATSTR